MKQIRKVLKGAAISGGSENRKVEDRVLLAEAPSRDAASAPLYGMEAIMAGTAYTDGRQDAEESAFVRVGDDAGSAQIPAGELEQLQAQRRERRRRNDMLSRLRVCAHRPRQHSFAQRVEGAARLAASKLRSRVTLPATVEQQEHWQAALDSAERLPCLSCAFRTCPYVGEAPDEAALQAHIVREHHQEI